MGDQRVRGLVAMVATLTVVSLMGSASAQEVQRIPAGAVVSFRLAPDVASSMNDMRLCRRAAWWSRRCTDERAMVVGQSLDWKAVEGSYLLQSRVWEHETQVLLLRVEPNPEGHFYGSSCAGYVLDYPEVLRENAGGTVRLTLNPASETSALREMTFDAGDLRALPIR